MWGWQWVLGCALVAQAADAPNTDLKPTVQRLLEELNSNELAAREAAEQKLLELGPKALDSLPEPNDRQPAEIKQRLSRVRQRLQRQRAGSVAEATRVSIPSGELSLVETIAQIAKQTGNTIVDYREQYGQETSNPSLSVGFDNVPFWQALDKFLDLASLTVYSYAGEEGIPLVARASSQRSRLEGPAYVGALRVEGLEFSARRDLRNDNPATLLLKLEVAWEPRLHPVAVTQALADVEAIDDQGNSIALMGEEGEFEAQILPGAFSTEIELPLVAPDRAAEQIASLRGKLRVLLPGGIETFRFTRLEENKSTEQRKAGVVVVFDGARRNGDVWELRVRVRFDETSGALESHRGWVFDNKAYLVSPARQTVSHDGFETTRQTDEEVGVAYLFDLEKGPAGYTLVYETPSIILSVPVEYELKNLKLP